jgi:hypothetical protein
LNSRQRTCGHQTTEIEEDVYDVENEGYPVQHQESSKQETSTFGKDITA